MIELKKYGPSWSKVIPERRLHEILPVFFSSKPLTPSYLYSSEYSLHFGVL